jgi:ElaB/YqjD/DUF883 family membrane-anchored ribosome-binding protein
MAVDLLTKSATLDDVIHEFGKMKSVVADAVDDGVRSALRAARKGRKVAEDAIEDAIDDAAKMAKRNPLEAVGIACAALVITGGLVIWLASRRR